MFLLPWVLITSYATSSARQCKCVRFSLPLYTKQERSLFTARLEQTLNVPTAHNVGRSTGRVRQRACGFFRTRGPVGDRVPPSLSQPVFWHYVWLACWTQAQTARVQIAVTTQTVHTHRTSVHQAAKLVAALLRIARVTAGLAESNGSLPSVLWLTLPAGWLPRTGISSGTLRSAIEYGLALPFLL